MARLDEFHEAVTRILAALFAAFPIRQHVRVRELAPSGDEETLWVYADTLGFLRDEGFIRYDGQVGDELYEGVTLTIRAVAHLDTVPPGSPENQTWGQQFVELVREGSTDAAKTLAAEFLRRIAGF